MRLFAQGFNNIDPLFQSIIFLLIACLAITVPVGWLANLTNGMIAPMITRFLFSGIGIFFILNLGQKSDLGISKRWVKYIDIIIAGVLIAIANFPILTLTQGYASIDGTALRWTTFVFTMIAVSAFEELFFRALIFSALIKFFTNKAKQDEYRKPLKNNSNQSNHTYEENKIESSCSDKTVEVIIDYCPQTKSSNYRHHKANKNEITSIILALIISSAIFALIHLFNLFHRAPADVFLQLGYTFLLGLLFAVLYYLTKSIIPSIIVHALFNIGGLMLAENAGLGNAQYIWTTTGVIVSAITFSIAGIYITVRFMLEMRKTNSGDKISSQNLKKL